MYHVQYAKISFREIRFPDVWRGIVSFARKLILEFKGLSTRKAESVLALYQVDQTSLFTKFD